MTNVDDERKAVTKAQDVLGAMTPATARTDQIAFALRHASRLATTAMAQGFSSDAALNRLRSDAVTALNAVSGSLDARSLTQDMVDKAKRAVATLLAGFDQQGAEPIYVDASQRAVLRRASGSVDCPTLQEAVLAFHRLPAAERNLATIKVSGGIVYDASKIDRLHYASAPK